jgi:hypothetical protein
LCRSRVLVGVEFQSLDKLLKFRGDGGKAVLRLKSLGPAGITSIFPHT